MKNRKELLTKLQAENNLFMDRLEQDTAEDLKFSRSLNYFRFEAFNYLLRGKSIIWIPDAMIEQMLKCDNIIGELVWHWVAGGYTENKEIRVNELIIQDVLTSAFND